jgi:hypothetical protein
VVELLGTMMLFTASFSRCEVAWIWQRFNIGLLNKLWMSNLIALFLF